MPPRIGANTGLAMSGSSTPMRSDRPRRKIGGQGVGLIVERLGLSNDSFGDVVRDEVPLLWIERAVAAEGWTGCPAARLDEIERPTSVCHFTASPTPARRR
jgi:hypothetical protein